MLIFACNKRNHQNKNDMKHTITTLFLLLLLAVADMAKAQSFQPYKSGVIPYHGYAYPIVPGTETWKQIDYPQRVASLQLPVDTLRNISTARLLETCTKARHYKDSCKAGSSPILPTWTISLTKQEPYKTQDHEKERNNTLPAGFCLDGLQTRPRTRTHTEQWRTKQRHNGNRGEEIPCKGVLCEK